MANQPLPRQENPLLLETLLGSQSISDLSANNNSNLLAGQFRDVYIGESKNLNEVLNALPTASDAPFNAYQRQHDPGCLPDTRVDLLRDIYSWANGQDERCIFWLNGLAGTGKSTIARTVARRYYNEKRLGASFFFSRGGGDVGHAGKFVTSIAWQLASSVPSLNQYVCDAIKEHRGIANQSLRDQWQQLVLQPLSKLSGSGGQFSYMLVVDALDECDNDKDIRIIVDLLAEAQSLKTARLRIFLTSRPEIPIRHGISQMRDEGHRDFLLHNISPQIVDHDLSVFFKHNLKIIREEYYLDAWWPGDQTMMQLIQIAGGLFIWAATACRFISEGKRYAAKRLTTILQGSSSGPTAPEKHLDEIYTTVLKQSVAPEYTDEEKEDAFSMLRTTLGSIVVLLSSLSPLSLSRLLNFRKEDIDQTLSDLHSILDVPKEQSQPLRLHHPSFRDYLLNNGRCRDEDLWVDEKQAHQVLADSCIRLMSTSLRQYICGEDAPGTLVSDVKRSQVEQSLSAEVQYACLYWIEHVRRSGSQLSDDSQVYVFLREHLLHWLEAIGWMGKVSEGVHGIASLELVISSSECPGLWSFVHDAKRFMLYNRSAIEQAPLQIYASALVFAPTTSVIRNQFENKIPKWIKRLPRAEQKWNAVLQTLEGHTDSVMAVAFSPDGKTLASASDDETVKLWDAGSGSVLQTLEGHTGAVRAVAFSPDGKTLASASYDETVKLWDAGSGSVLQTLEGHTNVVNAIAFSPDGKTLASASDDETVKLWDTGSGSVLQTLEGHTGAVRAVAFSPDGKTLASASDDETVKLWDAGSGSVLQTLEGHAHFVRTVSLAFSPDGKTLASASDDETVKLWDAGSGSVLQTLEGYKVDGRAVAFSPDGKTLASASYVGTVKLWDAGSGSVLQTLEGDKGRVTAVAFSPNGKTLASISDKTVKLWDAGSGSVLQTLEGHKGHVTAVAFSLDGKTLASASYDETISIKLWDVGSGSVLQTFEGHTNVVNAIAFSPDGKTLASASWDNTVKLWDAGSGSVLQTLDISNSVHTLSFANDGTYLQTERGSILISTPSNSSLAVSHPQLPPAIFVKDQWISSYTQRILWLPPEYRPSYIAAYGSTVGFGDRSGRVIVIELGF